MRKHLTITCAALGLVFAALFQPALAFAAPVTATATPLPTPLPSPVPKATAILRLSPTHVLTISADGLDVRLKSSVKAKRVLDTEQETITYTLGRPKKPAGIITLTVRLLPSGSKFVFADLESLSATTSAKLSISSFSPQATLHDLGLTANLTPNKVQGVDYTSGPIGWVDFSRGAAADAPLFLSKAYRYDILTKTYPHGGLSTVRELVSETETASVVQSATAPASVNLGLEASGKQHSQRYFIVSSAAITDAVVDQSYIARITGDEWRWLDPLGSYDKAPYSIEPETRLGYVRSLVDMHGAETLNAYKETHASLLGDLLTNDLYTLGAFRSPDGLWRTDYTSTWVKSESGIVAPYVDTRHNEHLSQMSFAIAESLGTRGVIAVAECTKWADQYAAYLSKLASKGAVVRTPHGLFFGDYYDSSNKLKVHTSLNHAVGEMNYLYDMYLRTSDRRYVDLAEQIRGAVDDTENGWIRPNHDLFYQRNLSGSFWGTDYVTVTYFDLLGARMRIFGIFGQIDAAIERLLESKGMFLNRSPNAMVA